MTNEEMIEELEKDGYVIFEDDELSTLLQGKSNDNIYEYLCDEGYDFDERGISNDVISKEFFGELSTLEHVRLIEVLRENQYINPTKLIELIQNSNIL